MWRKMREWIKRHTPKYFISVYQRVRYLWIVFLFHIFHLFRIQNNRVVFCNVWGYGDNAKYIAEEMALRKTKAELIFITNHPKLACAPKQIKVVQTNSITAIFALATAKVWVDSNRKEGYIRKRKGQFYIQTWHGGVPLKKIEGDCEEYLGERYIQRAKWDSAMTDLYLSNGGFCTDMYRRAFWYTKEILECGTPRMDQLLKQKNIVEKQIRKQYGLLEKERIALYAPTYRNQKESECYLKDLPRIAHILSNRFQAPFVLFVRLHPLSSGQAETISYGETVKNASAARDFYELLEVSDVLITDYSNTMFEAALAGKYVFLYINDKRSYEQQRGLYFKIEELPFPYAVTEEDLRKEIINFNEEKYKRKIEQFLKELRIKETGKASQIAADRILKILKF